jgi:hypothetical protein
VDSVELIPQNEAGLWFVRRTLTIAGLGSRDGIGTDLALSVGRVEAAETDAGKRAAVEFGVALHLYTDDAAPTVREQDAGTRNGNESRSPQSDDRRRAVRPGDQTSATVEAPVVALRWPSRAPRPSRWCHRTVPATWSRPKQSLRRNAPERADVHVRASGQRRRRGRPATGDWRSDGSPKAQ